MHSFSFKKIRGKIDNYITVSPTRLANSKPGNLSLGKNMKKQTLIHKW
jgi:hypothetical protein